MRFFILILLTLSCLCLTGNPDAVPLPPQCRAWILYSSVPPSQGPWVFCNFADVKHYPGWTTRTYCSFHPSAKYNSVDSEEDFFSWRQEFHSQKMSFALPKDFCLETNIRRSGFTNRTPPKVFATDPTHHIVYTLHILCKANEKILYGERE